LARTLEARERRRRTRGRRVDEVIAVQDSVDGARRRRAVEAALRQPRRELACAPSRVAVARIDDALGDGLGRHRRRTPRPTRSIIKR